MENKKWYEFCKNTYFAAEEKSLIRGNVLVTYAIIDGEWTDYFKFTISSDNYVCVSNTRLENILINVAIQKNLWLTPIVDVYGNVRTLKNGKAGLMYVDSNLVYDAFFSHYGKIYDNGVWGQPYITPETSTKLVAKNCWYKTIDKEFYFFVKENLNDTTYGVDDGEFFEDKRLNLINTNFVQATNLEIFKALKKAARKKYLWNVPVFPIDSDTYLCYLSHSENNKECFRNNKLSDKYGEIFKEGKWAVSLESKFLHKRWYKSTSNNIYFRFEKDKRLTEFLTIENSIFSSGISYISVTDALLFDKTDLNDLFSTVAYKRGVLDCRLTEDSNKPNYILTFDITNDTFWTTWGIVYKDGKWKSPYVEFEEAVKIEEPEPFVKMDKDSPTVSYSFVNLNISTEYTAYHKKEYEKKIPLKKVIKREINRRTINFKIKND